MITREKVGIYSSFQGDIDGWSLMGSKKEKAIMRDEDWFLIDSLLQDIKLVTKGITSQEFSNNLKKRLNENCDNSGTVSLLIKLARNA